MLIQDWLSIVGTLVIVIGTLLLFVAGRGIFNSLLKTQQALCILSAHNPLGAGHITDSDKMQKTMQEAISTIYTEFLQNDSFTLHVKRFTVSGLSCIAGGSAMQIMSTVVARVCSS